MSNLLARSQPYINCKEKLLGEDSENSKTAIKQGDNKNRENWDKEMNKGP